MRETSLAEYEKFVNLCRLGCFTARIHPCHASTVYGEGSYTSNIFFFRNETGVLLFEEKGHQKDKKHVSRQHRYFNDISKRH